MNLKEETRNGYFVSAKMKRIWSLELQMTRYIIDFCKSHNLRIWAEGGTLLGAARHQGFIPWDDDIDLMMPRKDYDVLVSLASEIKDPYFLQCAYTDKEYYRGHAQLRLANTTAILPYDCFQEFNQSLFIDIFCYDGVPDSYEDPDWKFKLKRADQIEKILGFNSYRISIFSILNPSNFFYRILYLYFKSIGKNIKMFMEFEDMFREYDWDSHSLIAFPTFRRDIPEHFTKRKEWYNETIYLTFEDLLLPAPKDYDKVLCTQYGKDYMTPKIIATMHGDGTLFDTEKPYTFYLKEIRKKRKKEYSNKRLSKIKNLLHINRF